MWRKAAVVIAVLLIFLMAVVLVADVIGDGDFYTGKGRSAAGSSKKPAGGAPHLPGGGGHGGSSLSWCARAV